MSSVLTDPSRAIIRKQVRSVEFGLYTDQDVRERSVVEVVSSQAYLDNNSEKPLPRGLYDPRMGPVSAKDKMPCPTCAGRFLTCPGHFGHIEVCVPLYQPMLFSELLTLMGLKCFFCHKLRAPKRSIKIAYAKLLLLKQERLIEFEDLDAHLSQAIQREHEAQDDAHTEETAKVAKFRAAAVAMDRVLDPLIAQLEQQELEPTINNHHNNTNAAARSALRKYQIQLKREWKALPKCQSCGGFSPKLKHDQHNKVFQTALSAKHVRFNQSSDLELESALEYLQRKQTKKNKNKKPGGGNNNDSDEDNEGYSSEDTQRERNPIIDDEAEEAGPMEVDDDSDSEMDDSDDHKNNGGKKKTSKTNATTTKRAASDRYYMHPGEVKAQVQLFWEANGTELSQLFFSGKYSYNVFFCQAIAVPPSRFRPPMITGGMVVEHAQNQYLSKIIQENANVRQNLFGKERDERLAHTNWIKLQTFLNCLMDNAKDPDAALGTAPPGIRQILEKKEGIFRKHMMGKRVDYACRSVISPDPYVGTNEIGIPLHFAKTLTYPTPVTELNVVEMRKLVERGPDQYPGARWVEVQDKRIDLSKMTDDRRQSVAALLLKTDNDGKPVIVGRQLRHGDYVLMNRQPTLHKPGIMAHQVRILHNPNQKTIRMHYANCNTYNADFDGDEMNCHFPQSDVARAEAMYIAQTDLQYIVPTDGSPLRGLIQDHVCGGVKLTTRDTFLKRWEYQQLLFAALASLPRLELIESHQEIQLVPPAILKPEPLWTGKQVITTLLLHLCNSPKGKKQKSSEKKHCYDPNMLRRGGISLERKSKTPGTAFGESHQEHLVLIRDGELLRGILDKSAFGATDFSLVHGIYEAYGPQKAGLLLNALGRLFTAYIQYFSGHSCRMEDLILTPESDASRRGLVQRAYNLGSRACKAWADSEGGKVPIEQVSDEGGPVKALKPVEVASASAKISQLLRGPQGAENFAALDGYMMSQLNPLASDIIKECLPNGLAIPFPANTFGLMTTTGAKGSIVNQSQVTCALGQQALEGRRVPRMNSGRTLPSFAPYDLNPRADGFVMDRFLTGVRPQEYYFHCMAGREGLVDTAVKTSRSGYLQRCLVKHLEELKVCYDFTVRNGEGGVVQFLYGEDALDPTKASYLDCKPSTFEYMARNHEALQLQNTPLPGSSVDIAADDSERYISIVQSYPASQDGVANLLQKGMLVEARRLRVGSKWKRGLLCQGWHDAIITGIHKNGKYFDLKYLKDDHTVERIPKIVDLGTCGGNTETAVSSMCVLLRPAAADPIISSTTRGPSGVHYLGSSGACVSERVASSAVKALRTDKLDVAMKKNNLSRHDVGQLVAAKYGTALCAPGEAVGSIAAQSVGEPSTQMTLNTFHLAGAGANVTLGIPRLREIIMTAARQLKTPTMSIPLRDSLSEKKAIKLTRSFQKLTLMELIAGHSGVSVRETLMVGDSGEWQRAYFVVLKLHPAERIKAAFSLSLEDIARSLTKTFIPTLSKTMKMELKRSVSESDGVGATNVGVGTASGGIEDAVSSNSEDDDLPKKFGKDTGDELDNDDDDNDDSENEAGEEDGVAGMKNRSAKDSEASYSDDDNSDIDEKPDNDNDNNRVNQSEGDMQDDEAPLTLSKAAILVDGGLKIDKASNSIILQPLLVDPSTRPLLMVGLVEKAAEKTLVRSRRNIDQAFINKEEGRGRCLQTAGIHFEELWSLSRDIVDHNRLISNDIWAIRCAYGVEAARNSIVGQIRSVFGAYGIEVDPRHLTLIADYMTYEGGFKAMNRIGMEEMGSTLLQMSFETTAHFLTQAARNGIRDDLESPSANIVLGQPIKHGTGTFDLLAKASA